MIKKILPLHCFIAGVVVLFFCPALLAQTVSITGPFSSGELIEHAKSHDKQEVVFKGEVVGEVMPRGNFFWVNINDGANAIGIWAEKKLASDIKYAGDYKTTGDVIEVVGVFNRACPEHGGDLDIHARAIKIIKAGNEREHKINKDKIKLTITLSIILCLTLILQVYKLLLRKKLAK